MTPGHDNIVEVRIGMPQKILPNRDIKGAKKYSNWLPDSPWLASSGCLTCPGLTTLTQSQALHSTHTAHTVTLATLTDTLHQAVTYPAPLLAVVEPVLGVRYAYTFSTLHQLTRSRTGNKRQ